MLKPVYTTGFFIDNPHPFILLSASSRFERLFLCLKFEVEYGD
ncbi:hypothetical protein P1059_00741 [Pasteurella multocida subsp. gallicida P1059]|nr:hypothetical protein P1059_00741 [Pasteurella multocida subsp. gallicida P1059]